jgi:hypothetical protein
VEKCFQLPIGSVIDLHEQVIKRYLKCTSCTGSDILKYPRNSGERVSESSKAHKHLLSSKYDDSGTHGRKVDLQFFEGEDELCIFEFKMMGAGDTVLQQQLGKTIRLNRAVMEYSHKMRRGVRIPILFMVFDGKKKVSNRPRLSSMVPDVYLLSRIRMAWQVVRVVSGG